MGVYKSALPAAWLISLVVVVALSLDYSGVVTHFSGIADDQEQSIRFPIQVRVSELDFAPGQLVRAGDRLLEAKSPALESEFNVLTEQLNAERLRRNEIRSSMQAQVRELKAGLVTQSSELDVQIRKLQAKQKSAKKLLAHLGKNNVGRELSQEISELRLQKQAVVEQANAQIEDLETKLQASQRPIDSTIDELLDRQAELKRRREGLVVFAEFDGEVGSILVKENEIVAPYEPILTVHSRKPSFVKGYLHESIANDVAEDQKVWISSASASREVVVEGRVKSLGSRIVPFPERLKVNPLASAWGLEVILTLDPEHTLLLGERVEVNLKPPLALRLPFINGNRTTAREAQETVALEGVL